MSETAPRRTVAEPHRSWWPGWIWAVPIAAVLVVGWLALRALARGGETVEVSFDQAAGVKPRDTKVIYRGLEVGEVSSVALSPDRRHVVAKLDLQGQAKSLLRSGTRFWLIGAHPSLEHLASLKDALTGPKIGLEPGPGAPARRFIGLEEPPDQAPVGPQVPYRIRFQDPVGALQPGAEVSLQGFRIGRVTGVSLSYDAARGALETTAQIELEPLRLHILGASPAGGDWRPTVDAMLDRLVAQGLRARLEQAPPLVGERVVALTFVKGAPAAALAPDGGLEDIPPAPSADLADLEAQAGGVLTKANAVAARIQALPIEQVGADLRAITGRVRQLASSPEISRTLDQIDDATAQIDRAARQASPQIGPLAAELRRTADQADQTVTAANRVIGGDPTSQDSDLPSVLRQLSEAARSIRVLADELERHPEALVKGKPKDSP